LAAHGCISLKLYLKLYDTPTQKGALRGGPVACHVVGAGPIKSQ
jgi:hypothetical protein